MSTQIDETIDSRQRIPYWVPPEARGKLNTDTNFDSTRGFRYQPRDTYHPQFLEDLKALAKPVVAEGDSWFNFNYRGPHKGYWDLLEVLYYKHRRIIINKAYRGELLDEMVHGGLREDGTIRPPGMDETIFALRASKAKVFLISGGGNDLVGEPLRVLLNHKNSKRDLLRKDFAEYIINDYLQSLYHDAVNRVWNEVSSTITIITHGYANARPTGRAAFKLFGPWLKPSFDQQGIGYKEGKQIIKVLMEMFNTMLMNLKDKSPGKNLIHVDFRSKGIGEAFEDWDDEMHLDSAALEKAGDMLNDEITKIIGSN